MIKYLYGMQCFVDECIMLHFYFVTVLCQCVSRIYVYVLTAFLIDDLSVLDIEMKIKG